MLSLINGQQAQHISVRDRGFQYGDGCFETVRIVSNKPILWSAHLQRLRLACSVLNLPADFDALQSEVSTLLQAQEQPDGILKVIISRGEGGRGYAPANKPHCTRVLQLSGYTMLDTGRGARAVVCQHRLSSNAQLAGIKHLNRLDQVLASAQITEGFDEGLCLDQDGFLVEGCKSNIILMIDGALFTPDLARCGVEGVMLNYLAAELAKKDRPVTRKRITLEQMQIADEIFLCNSVFGVWPVTEICGENAERCWSASSESQGMVAMAIANELYLNAN